MKNDEMAQIVALHRRQDRTIAVTGGKGGVGKSTVSVNLAITFAQRGARTLALDADLGMADLNLLLGVAPARSLVDVAHGLPVEDALVDVLGIHLLPALNGSDELVRMNKEQRQGLLKAMSSLADLFDTIIVDVAAGIGPNQCAFAGAAADVIIVSTPDPLSMANAYSCLKVLSQRESVRHAYVIPNRVRNEAEAADVVGGLSTLVARFLDIKLTTLPHVPYDRTVPEAGATGVPIVVSHPDAPASRAIRKIARTLDSLAGPDSTQDVARLFWKRAFKNVESAAKEGEMDQ